MGRAGHRSATGPRCGTADEIPDDRGACPTRSGSAINLAVGRTPQAPWVSLLAAVMAILGTAACRTENPRGADMTVPFQSYTLDNGLTVILMPDHTVPVLQVAMR